MTNEVIFKPRGQGWEETGLSCTLEKEEDDIVATEIYPNLSIYKNHLQKCLPVVFHMGMKLPRNNRKLFNKIT